MEFTDNKVLAKVLPTALLYFGYKILRMNYQIYIQKSHFVHTKCDM